jgi:flagellar export protein FliJ
MARLQSIIRMRKWELDEKRRELVILEEARAAIIQQIDALNQEVLEQQNAASLEVGPAALGPYMNGVKLRMNEYEAELRVKDEEIEKHREEVTEAFRELKTYEIAEEQENQRLKSEEALRDQKLLDEQGMQSFLKKSLMDDA